MLTDFSSTTWNEAIKGFILHLKATRAPKTAYFYEIQLRNLSRWTEAQQVPLEKFGKRSLDAFLVFRQEQGKSQSTLHHDALCAKVFMKWCQKYDVIERSLLSDYEVRSAPKPAMYMPTQEDMTTLLKSVLSFYDPAFHPEARFLAANKRSFHRERNYAIFLTLLDSACRIGEVLSLKTDDYQEKELQIMVRHSKGREPRTIPLSKDSAKGISEWLKVRARVMKTVPKEQDNGWLFINEMGDKIDEHRFLDFLRRVTEYAEISSKITLHSLRRYSLNRLAKESLYGAQAIAGHKDPKTTLIYTQIDAGYLREVHSRAGVIGGIVERKEIVKKKRLL